MTIQAVSAPYFAPATARASASRQVATATPASSAEPVSISPAARDRLAADRLASSQTASFDTDKGSMPLDIEAYFTPPGSQGVNLDEVPLLLPSPANIEALSQHLSALMPDFLASHGIPAAPASITYDRMGQMQLPADYAYADAFRKALAEQPALERELQTTTALVSSMVEMEKSLPFQREYAAAASQAEVDAVLRKYSYLLSGNAIADTIALHFGADGRLTITDNDQALALDRRDR